MSFVVAEDVRKRAKMYYGDEICQVKSREMLKEMGLPNGLLCLKDIQECGYDKESGFVWLKQKKSYTHKFEKIGRLVSYAPEVSCHIEKGKITKLVGVKSKYLMIWIGISDIYVDDPPTGNITFQIPSGQFKKHPISAFDIEEDAKESKQVKEV
ncbi:uncharacterized protein LOC109797809 [Cajanus cajan]|uniref:Uncharacterized protein n=1 Tax=Cajanus cajan TaxID=3821 RepID=A0A151TW46_CAJCA|nr:uncharacterized protein LOC109797809 [Cajanus cajan]KYP71302.1 hypothetical protein KK1_010557 [Cajanus cajan]